MPRSQLLVPDPGVFSVEAGIAPRVGQCPSHSQESAPLPSLPGPEGPLQRRHPSMADLKSLRSCPLFIIHLNLFLCSNTPEDSRSKGQLHCVAIAPPSQSSGCHAPSLPCPTPWLGFPSISKISRAMVICSGVQRTTGPGNIFTACPFRPRATSGTPEVSTSCLQIPRF